MVRTERNDPIGLAYFFLEIEVDCFCKMVHKMGQAFFQRKPIVFCSRFLGVLSARYGKWSSIRFQGIGSFASVICFWGASD